MMVVDRTMWEPYNPNVNLIKILINLHLLMNEVCVHKYELVHAIHLCNARRVFSVASKEFQGCGTSYPPAVQNAVSVILCKFSSHSVAQ